MGNPALVSDLVSRLPLGQSRVLCPYCTPERRKQNIKDLSVTVDDDGFAFLCHHCGASGGEKRTRQAGDMRMITASAPDVDQWNDSLSDWLSSRGISRSTAERAGCHKTTQYFGRLQDTSHAIVFPYMNTSGAPYAYKMRSYPAKDFSARGAAQTLWPSHLVADWANIVICEGEMDALALLEAGVENPLSIPNGALNSRMAHADHKLRYLELHADNLKDAKRVVLFTDMDDPGQTTADELARRIGRSKCWTVSVPEGCKDANDVLIKHGPKKLKELVDNAKPWPVDGLYDVDHYMGQVMDLWQSGLQKGADTGLSTLDDYYSIVPGQLTVVTGYPGSGKSELVDDMMIHLADTKGWKFALCSFENEPRLHIAKLCSKYVGMPFFQSPSGRMNEHQKKCSLEFVANHFSFIHSADGDLTSLDSIIERLRVAVLRHGITGAVIDPYNYIQKPKDVSETEWISTMLSRVRSFAAAHGIHIWFIAHPTKMATGVDGSMPIPKGNSISGSAAWWAKADMGITVHRPDPNTSIASEIHVWKVRHSWTGKTGMTRVYFNESSSQYLCYGDQPTIRHFKDKIVVPF